MINSLTWGWNILTASQRGDPEVVLVETRSLSPCLMLTSLVSISEPEGGFTVGLLTQPLSTAVVAPVGYLPQL